MKKYFIKNLKKEEKEKIIENNEKLQNEIYDILYEDNMNYQYELGEILLNDKENKKNYKICDNYTSFYLKILNGTKFLENIHFDELKNYFNLEDIKQIENIEKKYKKNLKYYNNCNYGSDNFYKYEENIENLAIELLKIIETNLHEYENICFEDVKQYFIDDINEYWQNCYILNKKDFVLYEDIKQIKKYN